jgi:hypothetical protein
VITAAASRLALLSLYCLSRAWSCSDFDGAVLPFLEVLVCAGSVVVRVAQQSDTAGTGAAEQFGAQPLRFVGRLLGVPAGERLQLAGVLGALSGQPPAGVVHVELVPMRLPDVERFAEQSSASSFVGPANPDRRPVAGRVATSRLRGVFIPA